MFIHSYIQQFWSNFVKIFYWEAKLDTAKLIGAWARMQNAPKMIQTTAATACLKKNVQCQHKKKSTVSSTPIKMWTLYAQPQRSNVSPALSAIPLATTLPKPPNDFHKHTGEFY